MLGLDSLIPSPTGRGNQVAENQRAVELGIRWQVNLKMFGLDSLIPLSPWERARERASKPQACLFSERYESVIRTRFGF